MLTPRVTELPPLPATIARSLVATGIGPTVHVVTDTGQVHGPREVAELMTFRAARRAGVSAVAYQFSVRRKLRDADRREQARYIAATLD